MLSDRGTRRNNLIITGIELGSEDPKAFLQGFIAARFSTRSDGILAVQKISSPNEPSTSRGQDAPTLPTAAPPRYLITMKSCWEAQLIYSQRLQVLKNEQIYISEDLTPAESRLFYKARQLKKANIIHSTWTKEGQILFRKTYTQDPEELKEDNPLLLTNTNINIDTTTSQTQPIHAPILSKLKKNTEQTECGFKQIEKCIKKLPITTPQQTQEPQASTSDSTVNVRLNRVMMEENITKRITRQKLQELQNEEKN
jgi:hypothetical protein